MLQSEGDGLCALYNTNTIRVPAPIGIGELPGGVFIITEAIDLHPICNQGLLGKQLAALHLVKGPSRFGMGTDNYIGSTPQPNKWHDSWVDFLHMRLKYQFDLANFPVPTNRQAGKQLDRLPDSFKDVEVVPSLIHGDLWRGNVAEDEKGNPVIFDPAVY
ncbi:hypothetical protein GGI26_002744 [Coemansia sp. RSA 1358]|uniref:protein-ribulosamine 3-kinase n=1 Tax=Coemansia umbellata TaxID=1424467 RepID=A0ABQ8PSZ9_9FUNG|nr:hypothetical protein EDC05_002083 [Coemansia umbellata]KAJ2622943.1 hypothetical protein GGI26_002744 [Coemansia sp. RSA 1358]